MKTPNLIKKIIKLYETHKKRALATVIETISSTSGKVSFKMLITEEKKPFGTIGGGWIKIFIEPIGKCRL